MGEPEIGRCVFCRSDNLVVSGEGHYFVSCRDCDATGPLEKSRADAIAQWNAAPRQPAREWSGPDRWQIAATTDHNDGAPPTKKPPQGYEPIGAWQPYAANNSWTEWRRPLRKLAEVSGG